MQDDTQMTITQRRKYLGWMRPRYLLANRVEQTRLLDEMQAVTGLHRKSLLRLLHAPTLAPPPHHPTQQDLWRAGSSPVSEKLTDSFREA